MYNILISGYYGFNNIGDESILKAVVENLKDKLDDIDITVLSYDPKKTSEKYGVKGVNRKSIKDILIAIKKCDMLISGGGSLLQDVTSKKSIIYYLMIILVAELLGKKVFIYSQGMGPITSKINRNITKKILKRTDGIVVRDENSKEFLETIGIEEERIIVTADPVLRIKPANLEYGKKILEQEGIKIDKNSFTVGFAIKERNLKSEFIDEISLAIKELHEKFDANIVLIPFHYSEDMSVINILKNKVDCPVYSLEHKYLTDEMLSIIGNMKLLVGVRLHSLIHAAIMGVPMIGISYDPKINSFLKSIDSKAFSTIYDFRHEDFLYEVEKIINNKESIIRNTNKKLDILIDKLNENENMIKKLMLQNER